MMGSNTPLRLTLCTLAVALVSLPLVATAAETEEPIYRPDGTVRYGGEWVAIGDLLDACAKARAAVKPHLGKVEEAEARVAEINKAVGTLRADHRAATTPLEREKSQALARKGAAMRGLSLRKPVKPNKLRGSGGGRKDRNRSSHGNMDKINREREQQYQQALKRYNQIHEQAQKAYKEAQTNLSRLEHEIRQQDANLDKQQKPLLVERTKRTRDLRDAQQQIGLERTKVGRIAATLAQVPEALRLKHGAVEWQGAFYRIGELEALHKDLVAEIAAEQKALEADLATKGRSLPKTWQHARQGEADALKALIRGARLDIQNAK